MVPSPMANCLGSLLATPPENMLHTRAPSSLSQKEQLDRIIVLLKIMSICYIVIHNMIIIIGLGNPGEKFNNTPHNAGFMALDFFAAKNDFPEFKLSKKYEALTSEKNNVLVAKPETFMNESGTSAAALLKNKNEPMLLVVHDDIDLPLGKIKFSKDSGAGGHKGVQSIIDHLGNNNFIQLKIGVATSDQKAGDVVLKKFSPEKQEILKGAIEKSEQALNYFLTNGLEKTMNEYNK